LDLLVILEKIK